MILCDFNQVMISNLMVDLKRQEDEAKERGETDFVAEARLDTLRVMILKSLRGYRTKFTRKYGELVLCADDVAYWRKDVFAEYKGSRKTDRAKSKYDWSIIFNALNQVRDEIREHMPYKVIQVSHAEADDIIGTLCNNYGTIMNNGNAEPILILSADKDFVQLQKYWNVDQYNQITKKYVRINNPERFLREHILLGDKGDGVPNFMSDDDTFMVADKRQRSVPRDKLEAWTLAEPEDFCTAEQLRNYKRNKTMIDLGEIPEGIQQHIMDQFDIEPNPRSKIIPYFMSKRLRTLMESIPQF